MSALDDYLDTIGDDTLDRFYKTLAAFQRAGNEFAAVLATQRSELDAAHADEADRINRLPADQRHTTTEGHLDHALEMASQRSQFLYVRWGETAVKLKELRDGINELRDSQRAVKTTAKKESNVAQASE